MAGRHSRRPENSSGYSIRWSGDYPEPPGLEVLTTELEAWLEASRRLLLPVPQASADTFSTQGFFVVYTGSSSQKKGEVGAQSGNI